MDNNVWALQAYKSSDRLDAASRLWHSEPNSDPAARLVIEANPFHSSYDIAQIGKRDHERHRLQ